MFTPVGAKKFSKFVFFCGLRDSTGLSRLAAKQPKKGLLISVLVCKALGFDGKVFNEARTVKVCAPSQSPIPGPFTMLCYTAQQPSMQEGGKATGEETETDDESGLLTKQPKEWARAFILLFLCIRQIILIDSAVKVVQRLQTVTEESLCICHIQASFNYSRNRGGALVGVSDYEWERAGSSPTHP